MALGITHISGKRLFTSFLLGGFYKQQMQRGQHIYGMWAMVIHNRSSYNGYVNLHEWIATILQYG